MTRAEAAVWAFDLLTADNKAKEYPLNFTDVEPGTEEARAIAYLDSYGLFYGRDAESFRPDEPITRAEFVQLLQRMRWRASSSRRIRPGTATRWRPLTWTKATGRITSSTAPVRTAG